MLQCGYIIWGNIKINIIRWNYAKYEVELFKLFA